VYVDDLVLTGSDQSFARDVINHLGTQFSLKDMGDLRYFMGIEVIPTKSGLFLSQRK
jgi:hypothetical protein